MTDDQLEHALDRILTAADDHDIPASHNYKSAKVDEWAVTFEGDWFTLKDPKGVDHLTGVWKGMRTARAIVDHVRHEDSDFSCAVPVAC